MAIINMNNDRHIVGCVAAETMVNLITDEVIVERHTIIDEHAANELHQMGYKVIPTLEIDTDISRQIKDMQAAGYNRFQAHMSLTSLLLDEGVELSGSYIDDIIYSHFPR